MRRVATTILLALCLAAPSGARPWSRSYLAFGGGADILLADVGGDVMDSRSEGMGELGVGYQISDRWLIEATYGFAGRWEKDRYLPIGLNERPADKDRVFRVVLNQLYIRGRWAHSGIRTEYFKPELSCGVGFVQVSRVLRNIPIYPPYDESDMIVSGEVGVSALFVFSSTFMGWLGGRYRVTERRDIANDVGHLDAASVLFGFRVFLPSPRDVAEPEQPPKSRHR